MKLPLQCDDTKQLIEEYHRLTEIYSRAVAEFTHMIGVVSLKEYQPLLQATDEARRYSEDERDEVARQKLSKATDTARRYSEDARNRMARHIAELHC